MARGGGGPLPPDLFIVLVDEFCVSIVTGLSIVTGPILMGSAIGSTLIGSAGVIDGSILMGSMGVIGSILIGSIGRISMGICTWLTTTSPSRAKQPALEETPRTTHATKSIPNAPFLKPVMDPPVYRRVETAVNCPLLLAHELYVTVLVRDTRRVSLLVYYPTGPVLVIDDDRSDYFLREYLEQRCGGQFAICCHVLNPVSTDPRCVHRNLRLPKPLSLDPPDHRDDTGHLLNFE